MAKVTKVTLGELGEPEDGRVPVEVEYTLDFAPGDVGRSFRIRVELLGVDPVFSWPSLYVFRFPRRGLATGKFGWIAPKYLVHTPEKPGPVTRTAKADVPRSVLDEDPGFDWQVVETAAGPMDVPARREDEVFARVTLTLGNGPVKLMSSAQSDVQTVSV